MAADALVVGVCLLFIAFLVFLLRALFKWRGVWRWLALLPLVVIALVAARILIEPAAHNLWPFELLLWSAGCGLALLALSWVRRIYGGR